MKAIIILLVILNISLPIMAEDITGVQNACEQFLNIASDPREGYMPGEQTVLGLLNVVHIKYSVATVGSLSNRLEYKFLGTFEGKHYYSFPVASKLNKIFGLNFQTSIRAKDEPDYSDPEDYHRSLSEGNVEVSTHTHHDSIGHFVGYLWLSKTQAWESAKDIIKKYYHYKDNNNLDIADLSFAKNVKDNLATDLENYSYYISHADRIGDDKERDRLLDEVVARIDKYSAEMNSIASAL